MRVYIYIYIYMFQIKHLGMPTVLTLKVCFHMFPFRDL
jgi:hypothetical protein